MIRRLALAILVALVAQAAAAEVLRPKPRPAGLGGGTTVAAMRVVAAPSLRPRPRPVLPEAAAPFGMAMAAKMPAPRAAVPRPRLRPAALDRPAAAAPAVARSADLPRPKPRPRGLVAPDEVVPAAAVRVKPVPETTRPKKGSVCGDRAIRGETIPPIPARLKGCGLKDGVRVTEVDGVRLSTPITVDCPTAVALKTWVRKALKPAVGRAGVAELQIAAHYACRTRNNRPGAPISEHGRGRAVDIAAVVLGNGKVISVLTDYGRKAGKPLRAAHRAACGIFGTTLGPGSDGYHENHLHFDTARHRGGPYCR